MALEGTHSGHQHAGRGSDTGVAALDIQKLLCAQISTKACFSDGIVGQRKAQLGSQHAVAAVGDVGKGTAVDDGGVVFQRLYKVRVQRVLQQGGHGTGSTDLTGSDGLAVVGVGAYDLGKTLLQIGNAGGKAENCHHLAGNGDIKAVLAGGAVHLAAQTVHDEPQLAVVHVHAALPCDAAGVDVQRVALLDAVVDHGGQQVVGRADGVQVAGEVQVDILHGHYLCVSAAGCAALDTEHGAEGRLTQAEHGLFAQSVHGIGQTHAGGGFALARRGGADGGDEDQLALLFGIVDQAVIDLGLVAAIGNHVLIGKAQLGGDLGDGSHFGFLCDLDIGFHQTSSFGSRFYKHCTPPERPFCSHPALLSLAIRQDCCEKSPCLRAKNPAIQRTLLIKTTSDNKKGSFAQQLRKAAQTVGIDSPAIPALWCSTRFRQQRYGLYAVKIAQCRGVCQGKTYTNLSGRGPSILLRKTVLSLKSPTGAFIAALRSQTRTFPRCAWRRSGHTSPHFSAGTG